MDDRGCITVQDEHDGFAEGDSCYCRSKFMGALKCLVGVVSGRTLRAAHSMEHVAHPLSEAFHVAIKPATVRTRAVAPVL